MIAFRVDGIPVPQGSARPFKTNRMQFPILTYDNKAALLPWREAVRAAALRARKNGLLEGAVRVHVTFELLSPKARPKILRTTKQRARWAYPAHKPDLDKLTRAILDALTGALFRDDGQVVSLELHKVFSDSPGADVTVEPL